MPKEFILLGNRLLSNELRGSLQIDLSIVAITKSFSGRRQLLCKKERRIDSYFGAPARIFAEKA
jgi:hypothetical protein